MKRWFKRFLVLLVLGGVAGALVYAFLPKPVLVDLESVAQGSLQVYIEEDGKTRLRDRYTISAPLSGRLLRIKYKAGDILPKGEPVAVIEPADPALLDPRALAQAEARVRGAKATLEKAGTALEAARAGLDLAEAEYARAWELHQKNALAKTDLDLRLMHKRTRVEEYRAARYAEDVARFEQELAEAALLRTAPRGDQPDENSQFAIPAPPLVESGRMFHILRVFQESEVNVAAGTPLAQLGDPKDLEVEIDVLSSDAVKISHGARVVLEQWGGEEPLEGRVRLVEPSGFTKISALGVEEQRVNVIVDFSSADQIPPSLGDGFRVEAKIIVWEKQDVLQVPMSALFRKNGEWAVFRLMEQRAVLTPVEVGRRNGLAAEVLSGLSPGDIVIVHPSDRIAQGVKVRPR
ncbi:MAG: efflux RND transporter periplasmic adaptor subunit [Planctomycetales bacterium]